MGRSKGSDAVVRQEGQVRDGSEDTSQSHTWLMVRPSHWGQRLREWDWRPKVVAQEARVADLLRSYFTGTWWRYVFVWGWPWGRDGRIDRYVAKVTREIALHDAKAEGRNPWWHAWLSWWHGMAKKRVMLRYHRIHIRLLSWISSSDLPDLGEIALAVMDSWCLDDDRISRMLLRLGSHVYLHGVEAMPKLINGTEGDGGDTELRPSKMLGDGSNRWQNLMVELNQAFEDEVVACIENNVRAIGGVNALVQEIQGLYVSIFNMNAPALSKRLAEEGFDHDDPEQVRAYARMMQSQHVALENLFEGMSPVFKRAESQLNASRVLLLDNPLSTRWQKSGTLLVDHLEDHVKQKAVFRDLMSCYVSEKSAPCPQSANQTVHAALLDYHDQRWGVIRDEVLSGFSCRERALAHGLEDALDGYLGKAIEMFRSRRSERSAGSGRSGRWLGRWISGESQLVFLERYKAKVLLPLEDLLKAIRGYEALEMSDALRVACERLEEGYALLSKDDELARQLALLEPYGMSLKRWESTYGLKVAALRSKRVSREARWANENGLIAQVLEETERDLLDLPDMMDAEYMTRSEADRETEKASGDYMVLLESRYDEKKQALEGRLRKVRKQRDGAWLNQRIQYLRESWGLYESALADFGGEGSGIKVRLTCEVSVVERGHDDHVKVYHGEELETWFHCVRPLNHYLFYCRKESGSWHVIGRDSKGGIHRMAMNEKDASSPWYVHRSLLETLSKKHYVETLQAEVYESLCYPLLETLSVLLGERLCEYVCDGTMVDVQGQLLLCWYAKHYHYPSIKTLRGLESLCEWARMGVLSLYRGHEEEMPEMAWVELSRKMRREGGLPYEGMPPVLKRMRYADPAACGVSVVRGVSYRMNRNRDFNERYPWLQAAAEQFKAIGRGEVERRAIEFERMAKAREGMQRNGCRLLCLYDESFARRLVNEEDWITKDEWYDYRLQFAAMSFERCFDEFRMALLEEIRASQGDDMEVWLASIMANKWLQSLYHELKGWYDETVRYSHPDRYTPVMRDVEERSRLHFERCLMYKCRKRFYDEISGILEEKAVLKRYVATHHLVCMYGGVRHGVEISDWDVNWQIQQEHLYRSSSTLRGVKQIWRKCAAMERRSEADRRVTAVALARSEADRRVTAVALARSEADRRVTAVALARVAELERDMAQMLAEFGIKRLRDGLVKRNVDPLTDFLDSRGCVIDEQVIAAARARFTELVGRDVVGDVDLMGAYVGGEHVVPAQGAVGALLNGRRVQESADTNGSINGLRNGHMNGHANGHHHYEDDPEAPEDAAAAPAPDSVGYDYNANGFFAARKRSGLGGDAELDGSGPGYE